MRRATFGTRPSSSWGAAADRAVDHSIYDKRRYPIVEVREGYGEWVHTYEQTVYDEMDLRLLERLRTVDWSAARSVLDLACGTGRIGAWLRRRCPAAGVDGVDITPEMLDVARGRGIYRTLGIADVSRTGLPAGTYDLCTQSLADEHLPDLRPLYQEVGRVTKRAGYFVMVGYHPQFLMAGVPTHFNRAPGEAITIRSYVHLLSDHVKAAHAAGWSLQEMDEGLVDDDWLRKKPKWEGYSGLPISFSMVWRQR
jgi:SAM-dependent methyltransferase